jgi:probable rRNA maturation factor
MTKSERTTGKHGRHSARSAELTPRARRAVPAITLTRKSKAMAVSGETLKKLVAFVAGQEGYGLADVDLAIVDAAEMAELNRRHLHAAGPTDVLSFDLSEAGKSGLSAQIIVCADVAARQGPLRGLSPQHELMLYVVHGLLHLMGYEDHTVRGAARMHAREDALLTAFGTGPAFHASKV